MQKKIKKNMRNKIKSSKKKIKEIINGKKLYKK